MNLIILLSRLST